MRKGKGAEGGIEREDEQALATKLAQAHSHIHRTYNYTAHTIAQQNSRKHTVTYTAYTIAQHAKTLSHAQTLANIALAHSQKKKISTKNILVKIEEEVVQKSEIFWCGHNVARLKLLLRLLR